MCSQHCLNNTKNVFNNLKLLPPTTLLGQYILLFGKLSPSLFSFNYLFFIDSFFLDIASFSSLQKLRFPVSQHNSTNFP